MHLLLPLLPLFLSVVVDSVIDDAIADVAGVIHVVGGVVPVAVIAPVVAAGDAVAVAVAVVAVVVADVAVSVVVVAVIVATVPFRRRSQQPRYAVPLLKVMLKNRGVIDATHAYARFTKTQNVGRGNIDDNDDPPGGVNEWSVQKLQHALDNQARGKNQFEIVWRPPLGFFDVEHAIPPGGQWMIEFNPANALDCRKNVVESILGDLDVFRNPSVAGQVDFRVNEFFFYVYTVESNRFDHGDCCSIFRTRDASFKICLVMRLY